MHNTDLAILDLKKTVVFYLERNSSEYDPMLEREIQICLKLGVACDVIRSAVIDAVVSYLEVHDPHGIMRRGLFKLRVLDDKP